MIANGGNLSFRSHGRRRGHHRGDPGEGTTMEAIGCSTDCTAHVDDIGTADALVAHDTSLRKGRIVAADLVPQPRCRPASLRLERDARRGWGHGGLPLQITQDGYERSKHDGSPERFSGGHCSAPSLEGPQNLAVKAQLRASQGSPGKFLTNLGPQDRGDERACSPMSPSKPVSRIQLGAYAGAVLGKAGTWARVLTIEAALKSCVENTHQTHADEPVPGTRFPCTEPPPIPTSYWGRCPLRFSSWLQ